MNEEQKQARLESLRRELLDSIIKAVKLRDQLFEHLHQIYALSTFPLGAVHKKFLKDKVPPAEITRDILKECDRRLLAIIFEEEQEEINQKQIEARKALIQQLGLTPEQLSVLEHKP